MANWPRLTVWSKRGWSALVARLLFLMLASFALGCGAKPQAEAPSQRQAVQTNEETPVGQVPADEETERPPIADATDPATIEIHTLDGQRDRRDVTVADLGIEDIPVTRPSDAVLVKESPTLVVREHAKWTEYVSVWRSSLDPSEAMRVYGDQCESFSTDSSGGATVGNGETAEGDELNILIEPEGSGIRIRETVRVSTVGW